MQVTSAMASQVGRARLVNQDTVLVCGSRTAAAPWSLAVLADGMGGLACGEDASSLAVAALMRHLKSAQCASMSEDEMLQGFDSAHQAVRTMADARQVRMGCTLVAALVSENEAIVANVGDSRCYVVSDGAIECITVDHSLGFDALACEYLTDDLPSQNPLSHILTRSVGTEALPPLVDLWRLPVSGSGSFVLCSDGVHSAVSQETIRQAVSLPPQQAASELLQQAVAAGAGDDLSVAILSFDS